MHASSLQGFLDHLRRLTDPARPRELSDADLLQRFRTQREEAAFTLLVQRHGPMVLAVCRRILDDVHAAEDAFQATFLVLVRNAEKIRKQESLAAWLHGVAARLAHKARTQSLRRQAWEREILPPTRCGDPVEMLASEELRAALDEEIERLPDKYRTPLILCYLADKTHEQAARELGWPKSSVTARLAKARELLRRRLERRGFTAPAGFLAMLLTETAANAALPAALTLSTVRLGMSALLGKPLTATATVALADSVAKGVGLTKWLAGITLLAALSVAAISPLCMKTGSPSEKPAPSAKPQQATAKAEPRQPRLDWQGDPLPEGAIARMGSGRMRHPRLDSLAFSSDGKTLLSSNEGGMRIWDVAIGKLLRRFDLDRGKRHTSFCRSGDSITVATLDDKWIVTVQVLDAATGKMRRRISIKEPSTVANPTLSPDGKRLAVAHKNELCLYDTTSGESTSRIAVKGVAAWDIAFAADSKTVAFNDLSTGTIYLHDAADGKRVRELKRPGDTTLHLVFSPDGRFLVSMSQSRITEKGEISIWNVREGKEVHRLTHPFRLALSAAFSPDSKYVAIGGGRWGLVLWDVKTGKEVRRLSPQGGVFAIAYSPDGKIMSTASPRGAIRLWDTATWKVLPASADPEMQFVNQLRFSADGKRLSGDASACLVWDPATGRELQRFADPEEFAFTLPNDLRCLTLSPDGSLAAAANRDGTIALWDAANGKKKHVLKGHKFVWKLLFTADSRQLISNGDDAVVRVWDAASGRELHRLRGQTPLAISSDNRQLATADAKTPNVFVYDLATGRETKRFTSAQVGSAFGLAFAPDGRSLAAGGGPVQGPNPRVVCVWDMADNERVRSFEGHKVAVWCVAFSPDGRTVASGDGEGGLILWELASGRLRHRFVGHQDQIHALVFSPDGRTLAASSVDAPVYVWDVAGSLEPKPRRLSNDELQHAWTVLAAEDAKAAFQTIRRLAAAPAQALPLLRQHLKPVPTPDPKQVRQRVEMLDSDDFATRQKATEELEKQADAASRLLRQILEKEKPTLEVRKRLQAIVDGLDNKPEALRTVRAVEILEWIGTADAVRLLGELADGASEARLTLEANKAKQRLTRAKSLPKDGP